MEFLRKKFSRRELVGIAAFGAVAGIGVTRSEGRAAKSITPATPVSGMVKEGNKFFDYRLQQGDQGSLQSVALYADTTYKPPGISVATEIGFNGTEQYLGLLGKEERPSPGVLSANAYWHKDEGGTITLHPVIDLGTTDKGEICIGTGDTIGHAFKEMDCYEYASDSGDITVRESSPQTFDPEHIPYRDKPAGPVEEKDIFVKDGVISTAAIATPLATPVQ